MDTVTMVETSTRYVTRDPLRFCVESQSSQARVFPCARLWKCGE